MNELVTCGNLTKRFGTLNALDHTELHILPGRIIGLLGPNGSGKTTLIKVLTGLLRPTEGTVTIDGCPVGTQTKAIVSYLPDKMYYAGWMRAADLINLFADFYADFRR